MNAGHADRVEFMSSKREGFSRRQTQGHATTSRGLHRCPLYASISRSIPTRTARRVRSSSQSISNSAKELGLWFRGYPVFAESPCLRHERVTGVRYGLNMSQTRALVDCPVCGGSFEAMGSDGVLVHLLAFHPRSAEAHWVIEQLARLETLPHGRSATTTATGSHLSVA